MTIEFSFIKTANELRLKEAKQGDVTLPAVSAEAVLGIEKVLRVLQEKKLAPSETLNGIRQADSFKATLKPQSAGYFSLEISGNAHGIHISKLTAKTAEGLLNSTKPQPEKPVKVISDEPDELPNHDYKKGPYGEPLIHESLFDLSTCRAEELTQTPLEKLKTQPAKLEVSYVFKRDGNRFTLKSATQDGKPCKAQKVTSGFNEIYENLERKNESWFPQIKQSNELRVTLTQNGDSFVLRIQTEKGFDLNLRMGPETVDSLAGDLLARSKKAEMLQSFFYAIKPKDIETELVIEKIVFLAQELLESDEPFALTILDLILSHKETLLACPSQIELLKELKYLCKKVIVAMDRLKCVEMSRKLEDERPYEPYDYKEYTDVKFTLSELQGFLKNENELQQIRAKHQADQKALEQKIATDSAALKDLENYLPRAVPRSLDFLKKQIDSIISSSEKNAYYKEMKNLMTFFLSFSDLLMEMSTSSIIWKAFYLGKIALKQKEGDRLRGEYDQKIREEYIKKYEKSIFSTFIIEKSMATSSLDDNVMKFDLLLMEFCESMMEAMVTKACKTPEEVHQTLAQTREQILEQFAKEASKNGTLHPAIHTLNGRVYKLRKSIETDRKTLNSHQQSIDQLLTLLQLSKDEKASNPELGNREYTLSAKVLKEFQNPDVSENHPIAQKLKKTEEDYKSSLSAFYKNQSELSIRQSQWTQNNRFLAQQTAKQ